MNDELIRKFVAGHHWTFAKTYAKTAPHEYIVKDDLQEDDRREFEEIVMFIREKGKTEEFEGKMHIYYYLDGKKYWTMGAPLEETRILNRADSTV